MSSLLRCTVVALALLTSAAWADSALDNKIEQTAEASYNFRAVLGNRVRVESKDGIVTLSGTVLDRDQRALAEDTVRSLPGVVEVLNHLDVSEPDQERSDGWIALKIRSILLIRSKVSAANTEVSVHDGVVTLAGTAESEAQKELTESYARGVQGVRAVRNQMAVSPAGEPATATAAAAASKTEPAVDDGSVTTQVKAALLARDPGLALHTQIETNDGTVTIRGTARSRAEKDLVSSVAREIRGVHAVANQMVVSVAE